MNTYGPSQLRRLAMVELIKFEDVSLWNNLFGTCNLYVVRVLKNDKGTT